MARLIKKENFDLDQKFEFNNKIKRRLLTTIAIGTLCFVVGLVLNVLEKEPANSSHHAMASVNTTKHDVKKDLPEQKHENLEHHNDYHWTKRLWATLWFNNVYFTGIAVIGIFFTAYNYVSWAGWSASIIRIPLAMPSFLLISGPLMLLLFFVGGHDLFHWLHEGVTTPGHPNYDKIIDGKAGYLNLPFYLLRMILYFFLWIFIWLKIRNLSKQQDLDASNAVKKHDKIIWFSALFLVIFGISSSTSAWDWIMSIDTHWYSTMFGWYHLASWHVAGLATITLIVIYLKEAGYLPMVNENHLHDLGKFMFAFSIFWTYVWFGQFLLIYYANISEETTYFIDRLLNFNNIYTPFFIINILINFCFPFLVLMPREAKRKTIFLKIVAYAIIIGHWLDFFLMVHPGTLKQHGGISLLEIGTFLIYAGIFGYTIAYALSKLAIVPKNHPYLEESLNHNI